MTPTRWPVKSTPSCGQLAGVIPVVPAKRLEAREVGHLRGREAAGGHDAEARRHAVAAVGRRPSSGSAASSKTRGGHAGLELDVAAQVEAVGDVVEVAQDLRLGGVALASSCHSCCSSSENE